jgi:sortase A
METDAQVPAAQEHNASSNFTGLMGEVQGSEEFREIIGILIQEKRESVSRVGVASNELRRKFKIWAERILLVSGLILLMLYGAARLESWLSSQAAVKSFDAAGAPSVPSVGDVAEASGQFEPDLDLDDHQALTNKNGLREQSGFPLALLRISKIGLEVPLLEGTDKLTLNHAVGRIAGTARPGEPGNIGVAGHRDSFFRGLKDIRIGDSIELKRPREIDTYIVDEINIVNPSEVGVLGPRTASSLTLVTCYPFYFIGNAPRRYIVHASRTGFEAQKYNSTVQGSLTLADNK